ncbi:MAG: baseplate J/gp47 family protein [Patescibacteria group bacterium]|nr:baseplate J/gp47 family protein [Patescibacteria group bacterium]
MYRISSESDGLWQTIERIKKVEDTEIELVVSGSSPLLENLLAFKILKARAGQLGKNLRFLFDDSNYAYLEELLNGGQVRSPVDSSNLPHTVSAEKFRLFGFLSSLPRPHFNFRRLSFGPTLLLLLVIILITAGAVFVFYFSPHAKVTLTVDSEPLVKVIDIEASPNITTVTKDPPSVPAFEITAEAKQSESTPSSGQKEIGNKAVGRVTIYNKTTADVTFPAGTTVSKSQINADNLNFITKSDVTVPARTADPAAQSGYDPGTAGVDVVAGSLGDEYNVSSGSIFSVGTKATSDFVASNQDSFGGGSRQEVKVVTATDAAGLLNSLETALQSGLKKTLLDKVISGQTINEDSINYEVVSKNYDKNPGDQADSLTLNLDLKASVLAFSQNDLNSLVGQLLSNYVPDGYELFGKDQNVQVQSSQYAGGVLTVTARGTGFVVPKIDQNEIKRELISQRVSRANEILTSLGKISSYSLSRSGLNLLPFMPFRAKNLEVVVIRK